MDWFNQRLAKKLKVPAPGEAIPGREQPLGISGTHTVLGTSMKPPFPEGHQILYLGMGCFWGAERKFWGCEGVYTTAVGYTGGYTRNPTYEEVCSGQTGHTEAVLVVFDPEKITLARLLKIFWESHDPTQGMRQGNDVGTQYRSFIGYTDDGQLPTIEATMKSYQEALQSAGLEEITSEIQKDPEFYYAEEYHQQYLDKNPNGYCGLGGTGVSCAV